MTLGNDGGGSAAGMGQVDDRYDRMTGAGVHWWHR